MADWLPRPEAAFRNRTAQEPFESGDGRPSPPGPRDDQQQGTPEVSRMRAASRCPHEPTPAVAPSESEP